MKKVAIIGSGIGGLIAGNLLAQKGHQVTMFEKHTMPGGYVGGFWRKGFYFESGLHSFQISTSIFKVLKDIGVFEKLDFVEHKPMRFVSSDFDDIPQNYQDFKQMLYVAYPTEKESIIRYFSKLDQMYNVYPVLFSKGLKISKIVYALKFSILFTKYKRVTTSQLIKLFFPIDSPLYRFLNNFVIYPDQIIPISAGGFWFIYKDHWLVKGGMQSLSNSLTTNFEQLGGKLKIKAPVEKILTKENKAVGVICQGTRYDADYVISACDYKQTFLKLLEPEIIPATFINKIKQAEVCQSFVVVYLGLNISNEALHRLMQSPLINIFDVTVTKDIRNSEDADFFEHCKFYINSPSLEDPTLAPKDKSSLMIHTVASYHWMNTWGNGDRVEYLKLKDKMRETLIRRAAQILPDLYKMIEFQDAATPLTFERYTHNTGGATNAWSWNPLKMFYKKSISTNVVTPVQNLLIGSSWATQLGGIPFAIKAGKRCSKLIGKG